MFNVSEADNIDGDRVILNNDNTAMRQMMEQCISHAKVVLNPIIDWDDDDVWEFIKSEDLSYCSLYDEGRTRLGCIGCPMNTNAAADLERWPSYKEMYLTTFDKMLAERERVGRETKEWDNADDVMKWWLSKKAPSKGNEQEYQMMLEDFNNPYTEE